MMISSNKQRMVQPADTALQLQKNGTGPFATDTGCWRLYTGKMQPVVHSAVERLTMLLFRNQRSKSTHEELKRGVESTVKPASSCCTRCMFLYNSIFLYSTAAVLLCKKLQREQLEWATTGVLFGNNRIPGTLQKVCS